MVKVGGVPVALPGDDQAWCGEAAFEEAVRRRAQVPRRPVVRGGLSTIVPNRLHTPLLAPKTPQHLRAWVEKHTYNLKLSHKRNGVEMQS